MNRTQPRLLRLGVATLTVFPLFLALSTQPAGAQADAKGPIQSLRFAIEQTGERTEDPHWLNQGGQFVLAPGETRAIRAVADGAGGRVYPSTTYRVSDGGGWLSLSNAHPNMGTTYVTVARNASRNQIGTVEWTLAAGFQPADGATRGTIRISTGDGSGVGSGLGVASSSAVVGDLYRAILLRQPDSGAQDFIAMVDREGVDGIFRAASRIALSTESRTTVAQKGGTAEQRLAALFQHLQGRSRRAITVAEWDRYRAQLDRGEIETVVLDLLWSDAFFARHRLNRPATRPLGDSLAARDTRFRGQDRDGDGRITRAEWSGNDVSFANHDWNDDGVLAGLEIQASGAAGTVAERFTALDRDRDALLRRAEWPGRGDDFSRLDRNGDGAVSRGEFEHPDVPVLSREDRFRALDANRDSVLVADEMRGAAELFAQLDANHDNRVALAEYLNPPTSLSRLQLFMRWDHDDSGYLARGEWHADTASFNALDGDLDGLVSLGEYLRG